MKPSASPAPPVVKFVAHSRTVGMIALAHGWLPGARYTNLRDVRKIGQLGFLDIDWKNYNFQRHLAAAKATQPYVTVARDIVRARDLRRTLDEASALAEHCQHVVVVPKARSLAEGLEERIPSVFLLGYSVPTRYGGTVIPPSCFKRPVHLLGGRPDRQLALAARMPVVSLDCNRFTLDAGYGDYFDGTRFRPHPVGGYQLCLEESLLNINRIWDDYRAPVTIDLWSVLGRAA